MTCNPFRMKFRLCLTATMAALPCQDSANGAKSNPTDLDGQGQPESPQEHLQFFQNNISAFSGSQYNAMNIML